MDTIRINKGNTKLIAHRGLSGLEAENTCPAFVAAGNRSYFGVETDVHVTADGKFVITHDTHTTRVTGVDLVVEQTDLQTLRALPIIRKDGLQRIDQRMPTLEEYLQICRQYDKVCVLELKNPMPREAVAGILEICSRERGLENMLFISFDFENMRHIRSLSPDVAAQFLQQEALTPERLEELARYDLGLDIWYKVLTREAVEAAHARCLAVNCWTVDDPAAAEELVSWGVDQITSNILE